MVHIVNGHRGGRYGFPSCHAANTFGLAFFVWFLFRKRWLTVFMMGWALLTCYSRVYLGVHYPGDLIAGTLVGLIAAYIVYRLFLKVSGYKTMKKVPPYLCSHIGGRIDDSWDIDIFHGDDIAGSELMIYRHHCFPRTYI